MVTAKYLTRLDQGMKVLVTGQFLKEVSWLHGRTIFGTNPFEYSPRIRPNKGVKIRAHTFYPKITCIHTHTKLTSLENAYILRYAQKRNSMQTCRYGYQNFIFYICLVLQVHIVHHSFNSPDIYVSCVFIRDIRMICLNSKCTRQMTLVYFVLDTPLSTYTSLSVGFFDEKSLGVGSRRTDRDWFRALVATHIPTCSRETTALIRFSSCPTAPLTCRFGIKWTFNAPCSNRFHIVVDSRHTPWVAIFRPNGLWCTMTSAAAEVRRTGCTDACDRRRKLWAQSERQGRVASPENRKILDGLVARVTFVIDIL